MSTNSKQNGEIDWELRPGGMLVQKRGFGDSALGAMIKIRVSNDSYQHHIAVPAQSSFGDLKRVLKKETGLEPNEQRLLFRGKEKEDSKCLDMAGVKDMSKVVLLEDPASKDKRLNEMKNGQGALVANDSIAKVRAEVNRLAEKLLKLDRIEADGEAKVQRRVEVRRVQSFVDTLDNLKARSCRFVNSSSEAPTEWETFNSVMGRLNIAKQLSSSTKTTQNWETFD